MINQTEFSSNTSLYTLQLASQIENLNIVENFIDNLSQKYGFSNEVYANVMTCLNEAVNNAIVHGNRQDPDKRFI